MNVKPLTYIITAAALAFGIGACSATLAAVSTPTTVTYPKPVIAAPADPTPPPPPAEPVTNDDIINSVLEYVWETAPAGQRPGICEFFNEQPDAAWHAFDTGQQQASNGGDTATQAQFNAFFTRKCSKGIGA